MRALRLAAALASLATAAASAAETAAFLKLAPGPRPIGLGEAFTAVADDLNAQAVNPGGLAQLGSREVGFSHAELLADTRLDALGYAHPLGTSRGTLAAGLLRLSHGAIAGRDASGRASGEFEASDTAIQLAYGSHVPGLGSVGVNVKYLESRLAYATARGVAVDVGLHRRGRGAWSWGAAVRNLGNGLRYAEHTDALPLAVAAGAAVRVNGSLLLSGEIRHRASSGGIEAGVGTEYSLLPSLVIRGGYRSASRPEALRGSSPADGMGMGFGIRLKKATFDYAITPQGELGQAQRLSISTRF